MTRELLTSLLAAVLCVRAVAGEQTSPTPSGAAIPANSSRVVVDVVVIDAQHSPVHKLTTADFTVFEDGQKQTIQSFQEHNSWEAAEPMPQAPTLSPGIFTNYTNAPASGALNLLMLDALNTPTAAKAEVRKQMLNYLKEVHPGTRMAIFGLTTKLVLLQGFTSGPDLLRTVLAAKKDLPKAPPSEDDQINADKPGGENPTPSDTSASNAGADEPMAETADRAFGNEPGAAQVAEALQQFETETESLPLQLRARATLDAFNQLGRYLSALPGRKNLVWFSGSFPITILPSGDPQSPFSADVSSADELHETANLLFRSQVAIYPVDDRGSVETSLLKPKSPGSKYGRIPGSYSSGDSTSFEDAASEHGSMQALAEATGGEANFNTKGLIEAVEEAFERGSHYYTLTYAPTDQRQNGSYRKIRVEAARPGLTLEYRRGYFADDPNVPRRQLEAEAPGEGQAPPYDPMRAAMMLGSPEPTEIILAASVRPATAGPEPGVAPGNTTVGTAKGPFRRYTVLFGVDASHVLCPADPDGTHQCALQAAVFAYDSDGALVNSIAGKVRSTLSSDDYAARSKTDFRFTLDIGVPAQGDYFLRIGVQDETTRKVGAAELPVAAVSKLAPLPPQPAVTK